MVTYVRRTGHSSIGTKTCSLDSAIETLKTVGEEKITIAAHPDGYEGHCIEVAKISNLPLPAFATMLAMVRELLHHTEGLDEADASLSLTVLSDDGTPVIQLAANFPCGKTCAIGYQVGCTDAVYTHGSLPLERHVYSKILALEPTTKNGE